jgi:DNA-binding beta-propeller fold protein YncE
VNLDNSPDPTLEPGRFYGPRSVTVADGEIYVTDTGNERVQVFASDGTFLRAFGGHGTEAGKLIEPVGITIGADGNVWVADSGNARLSVFTKQGAPLAQIPVPSWDAEADREHYLRLGPDGRVYATSPGNGSVEVVEDNQPQTVVGPGDPGEVRRPLGIAIADDGSMLLTDPELSVVGRVVPEEPADPGMPVGSPVSWMPEPASVSRRSRTARCATRRARRGRASAR